MVVSDAMNRAIYKYRENNPVDTRYHQAKRSARSFVNADLSRNTKLAHSINANMDSYVEDLYEIIDLARERIDLVQGRKK